jgi:hypothetical protein
VAGDSRLQQRQTSYTHSRVTVSADEITVPTSFGLVDVAGGPAQLGLRGDIDLKMRQTIRRSSERVVAAHIWLGDRDKLEAIAPEIGSNEFLDHQIACQSVQLLDQHKFRAIAMHKGDQLGPTSERRRKRSRT